jgi:hypothetical protein
MFAKQMKKYKESRESIFNEALDRREAKSTIYLNQTKFDLRSWNEYKEYKKIKMV